MESLYKDVVNCFHSYWFKRNKLLKGLKDNKIEELHIDKVKTLSELLNNFDTIKLKYQNEFEKFYDLKFLEGFIEEYDKKMRISEKYKGNTMLIFSILFCFLVDLDYIQTNERTFHIKLKSGKIKKVSKVLPQPLKGEKSIENYNRILENKSLRVHSKPGLFLVNDYKVIKPEGFTLDYYVLKHRRRDSLYFPDYLIVALFLDDYMKNIGYKNTRLLIKGEKKILTIEDYFRFLYPNKTIKDISKLSNEESLKLLVEDEDSIEFFGYKDLKRCEKICDEILEKIKEDEKNNPYFNPNLFSIYPNLKYLKSRAVDMKGSYMLPISDFLAMGGQLK